MAWQRVFKLYNIDGSYAGTLDPSRVVDASFEYTRQGGCGSGTLVLRDKFRNDGLNANGHIQFCDNNGVNWYLGRVEDIQSNSPSGCTIRLHGWLSYLNDVAVGGRGKADVARPHAFTADSEYFENDPDRDEQEFDVVSTVKGVVDILYTDYVSPNTPISSSSVDMPSGSQGFTSMVFRGQESVSQIVRQLAVSAGWMSWGVDHSGQFFMKNLPAATSYTFQEGVDVVGLQESEDRSLMFNRLILTGGPIYGTSKPPYYYHYTRNIAHFPSIANYGEKRVNISMPWIRTDADTQLFADQFFQEYAGPTVRYTFGTIGLPTLGITLPICPWLHRVAIKNAAGVELKNAVPTSIQYSFNAVPMIRSMTLGPEQLDFPTTPQSERKEDFDPTDLGDGTPLNCQGLDYPCAPPEGWEGEWTCKPLPQKVHFKLLEDLEAGPECLTDPPTTATARAYKRETTTGPLEEITGDDGIITIVNSSKDTDAVAGTYGRAAKWPDDDTWEIEWLDCEPGDCGSSSSG